MSVRKLTTSLFTALAFFAGGQSLIAQNNNYLTPGDPFQLERELAWFEPVYDADILDVKPKKRANTGWFGTVDKLALYASRPNLTVGEGRSERHLDSGSGTRYEFGYMTPEESGLLFSFGNFSASELQGFPVLRIPLLNDEEITDDDAEFPVPPFGLDALLPIRGNNFGYNTRFYYVGDTVNSAELEDFELMKTWRLEPYHYGGILEPMVGLRYVNLTDRNGRAEYSAAVDDIDSFLDSQVFIPGAPIDSLSSSDAVEQYRSYVNETDNELLTAQIGARYFKYSGRIRYTAEGRLFSGISLQNSRFTESLETTVYSGFGIGDDLDHYYFSELETYEEDNEEFFIGFDLRSSIGIQLTKMIQVRGGVQLLHLSSGIWRGGVARGVLPGGDRDQDFLAMGFTYGLELNR